MWLTTVLLASLVTLVGWWIWDRKQKFTVLKKKGISGPQPFFWFGNMAEWREMGLHGFLKKYTEKYGKTYGYYMGAKPNLVTSDLDLVQEILVKQFHRFHSRREIPVVDPDSKYIDMFMAEGDRWRFLRSISSPSFSARRMKEMSPLINDTVDDLMDVFQEREKEGKPFDIYSDWQKMTLDVIACCALGIEVKTLKNPDHIILEKCRELFTGIEERTGPLRYVFGIASIFPFILKPFSSYLMGLMPNQHPWFKDAARQIISARQESKTERVDFIQLMLNASVGDVTSADDTSLAMNDEDPGVDSGKLEDKKATDFGTSTKRPTGKRKLGVESMITQCILFLLAGFETTSTLLAFVAQVLVTHPHILDKLQKEIDEHFPEEDPKPDYLTVRNLNYMNMFINEVLRLHPIAQLVTTRTCYEDCDIKGIHFDKGNYIQFHMEAIHQDPEQWGPEDPKEFVPERFLPERVQKRHPMAWMPFGNGPRNCIGMRFALMEAKITLVRVLKKYNIVKCDKTQIPLPTSRNSIFRPVEGVWVKLEQRI